MSVSISGAGSISGLDQGFNVTSGLVGIGTDDPSWGVSTGLIVGDGASAKGITLFSNSANVGDLAFADATSGTARYRGLIRYDHSDDSLALRTNSSERLRITSDGDLFVAGTGGMNTTQLPNGNTININGTSSNDGFSVIRYNAGYGAYGLNIGRSKSSTIGTNVAVTNGNDLGHISFYGADGTDFNMAAQITAQVDGTPSDGTDMPGRLVFKTSPDGSSTPAERLRITSGGNMGVGNADPTQAKLVAQTASGSSLAAIKDNTGGSIVIGGVTQPRILMEAGHTASEFRIYTAGGSSYGSASWTERLRVTSGGNLQLYAGGNLQMASNGRIFVGNGGNATDPMFANVSDTNTGIAFPAADTMMFTTGGSERLRIKSDGDFYIAWNDGQFVGQYYDANYYMGLTFASNNRELYIDNKSNDTRADILFRTLNGSGTPVERVRISSAGQATFKYKVNIGDSHTGGEILALGKTSGTSYMGFSNGGTHVGFVGYADQLIVGGASNEFGIRSQDDLLFAAGGNAERLRITSAGLIDTNGNSIKIGSNELRIVGTNDAATYGWAGQPGIYASGNQDFRIHSGSGEVDLYVDGFGQFSQGVKGAFVDANCVGSWTMSANTNYTWNPGTPIPANVWVSMNVFCASMDGDDSDHFDIVVGPNVHSGQTWGTTNAASTPSNDHSIITHLGDSQGVAVGHYGVWHHVVCKADSNGDIVFTLLGSNGGTGVNVRTQGYWMDTGSTSVGG